MTIGQYFSLIYMMVPAYSAATVSILLLLSLRHTTSRTECKVKQIFFWCFFLTTISWLSTFMFFYLPEGFVYMNVLCYFSYLMAEVLFYHFFYILTQTQSDKEFNRWHYLLPVLISVTLLVWSFFVPFETQLMIIEGRKYYVPEGYELYTQFFFSRTEVSLLFGLVYIAITIVRLRRYTTYVYEHPGLCKKTILSVHLLLLLTVSSIFCSLLGTLYPYEEVYKSPLTMIACALIVLQQIVLTYYIVTKQFLSHILIPLKEIKVLKPEIEVKIPSQQSAIEQQKQRPARNLNQKEFELYIKQEKPYINPQFKMESVVSEFNTNRTYVSKFINQTYGMNFNRYINQLRLREFDRIAALPINAGKAHFLLVTKAGFKDTKHYMRALKAKGNEEL
ncbi:AraC family transcriptional regulator [Bacteroides sp. 214]|nr:AraC family transcriptional regulator [Bacteroides sp. 214]